MTAWKPPLARSTEVEARMCAHVSTRQWFPFDKCLACEWEGDNGETYIIAPSRSDTWLCTCSKADGTSTKFTLTLDRAASTIWWGIARAYYSDVLGESIEGQLSWYRPHASKPSFVWWAKKQLKTRADSKSMGSLNRKPKAPQEEIFAMPCGTSKWEAAAQHLKVSSDAQAAVAALPPATQKLPSKIWMGEKSDQQIDGKATMVEEERIFVERAGIDSQDEKGTAEEELPAVSYQTKASREADSAAHRLLEAVKRELKKKEQARVVEGPRVHPAFNQQTSAAFATPPPLPRAPVASGLFTQSSHSVTAFSCGVTPPPGLEALSAHFPASSSVITAPYGLISTSSSRCVTPPPGLEADASLECCAVSPPPCPPMPQQLLLSCGANPSKSDEETRIGSDQSSQAADDLDNCIDPADLGQPVPPHQASRQRQAYAARTRASPSASLLQAAQSKRRQSSEKQRAPVETCEFLVTLDKTGGTKLGVDLDFADRHSLHIDGIGPDGLFQRWNESNPSLCVEATDRIVEANGIRGKVVGMIEELKRDKILKLVISRANAHAHGAPAQNGKGKEPERLLKMAAGAHKGDRPKARQQHQSTGGPAGAPAGVEAAEQVAFAAHTRTGACHRALHAASRHRMLLQGRWHDSYGEVGYVKDNVMVWAQPVEGMTHMSNMEYDNGFVQAHFLGETLSGVLKGNNIYWSDSDVWWRDNSVA